MFLEQHGSPSLRESGVLFRSVFPLPLSQEEWEINLGQIGLNQTWDDALGNQGNAYLKQVAEDSGEIARTSVCWGSGLGGRWVWGASLAEAAQAQRAACSARQAFIRR